VSTDDGWIFLHRGDIYVGSVGRVTARRVTLHTLPVTTSAFRAADGKRLWTKVGMPVTCNGAFWSVDSGPLVGCEQIGGTVTYSGAGEQYRHFQLIIEGFDAATGAIEWRWNAGDSRLFDTNRHLVQVADNSYLLRRGGKLYELNTATGVRPISSAPVGWCADSAVVRPSASTSGYDMKAQAYEAGERRPCTEAGHHPALPATLSDFAVTRSAGVSAWSQSDGIHAATQRR